MTTKYTISPTLLNKVSEAYLTLDYAKNVVWQNITEQILNNFHKLGVPEDIQDFFLSKVGEKYPGATIVTHADTLLFACVKASVEIDEKGKIVFHFKNDDYCLVTFPRESIKRSDDDIQNICNRLETLFAELGFEIYTIGGSEDPIIATLDFRWIR